MSTYGDLLRCHLLILFNGVTEDAQYSEIFWGVKYIIIVYVRFVHRCLCCSKTVFVQSVTVRHYGTKTTTSTKKNIATTTTTTTTTTTLTAFFN